MMFQDASSELTVTNAFAEDQFENIGNLSELRQEVCKGTIRRITSLINKDMKDLKVLEIGVGSGELALRFLEAGADYTGVEPSRSLYEDLNNSHPELASRVLNGHVQAVPSNKKFDLLVMVDTLEHIPDPVGYLSDLKRYLVSKGAVYIEVPNESLLGIKGALRAMLNVHKGFITHPGHVNLFQLDTMKKTLIKAKYDDVSVSQFSIFSDFPRMCIALKGKWRFAVRGVTFFIKLFKIDLLLGQGNISAVGCIKD
jgi:2-polyprenyl-3-methyl-5-hydroxy-6-metoxy-1,4-benzoquinol methylase